MLIQAPIILHACGAFAVHKLQKFNDPTNEEEFNQLEYESNTPITWQQYQSAIPIVKQKKGIKILRNLRDQDLKNSDWICTLDNVNSIENIQDIFTYRQTLRDFPDTATIIWKTFPEELDLEAMGYPKLPPIIRKQSSN